MSITDFYTKLISINSGLSSSRFLNTYGGIIAGILLIVDTVMHKELNSTNFGIFLAYCGAQYTGSKYIVSKSGQQTIKTTETLSAALPTDVQVVPATVQQTPNQQQVMTDAG